MEKGGAESAGHRAGAPNQRGRAPTSANSPQRESNRGRKGVGMVPYLGTTLEETWRKVWSSGWPAR
jgi:hypothetical protein